MASYTILQSVQIVELFSDNTLSVKIKIYIENIVAVVLPKKILICFVQVLLKNIECLLVDVFKLGFMKPQYGGFYWTYVALQEYMESIRTRKSDERINIFLKLLI